MAQASNRLKPSSINKDLSMQDQPQPKRTKETVSLVLGSGGARGLAHIGIIQWLQENDFDIRSVAGSSMGALIGGIFAAGRLEHYTEWVRALTKAHVLLLLDFSFSRAGLIKGERIIELLKELVGDRNIEDLPISFTAVAVDGETGKEIWLSRGSLFDAIRASIAIPTFFTPYDYQGRKLLDGGLVNPVPIAPTLKDLTDLTIAVNLNGKQHPCPNRQTLAEDQTLKTSRHHTKRIKKFIDSLSPAFAHEKPPTWGLFDVINHSFETMQSIITHMKLAANPPDVIIEIPKNACGAFEFYRAEEMIALGRLKAEAALGGSYCT
jgi:NTE family protein